MKKSVSINTSTVDFIINTTKSKSSEPRWSSAINSVFDQLRLIISQNVDKFTDQQLKILIDVYKNNPYPTQGLPPNIATDIMIYFDVIDLSELDYNYTTLVRLCHGLTAIEQISTLYFIQAYNLQELPDNLFFGDRKNAILEMIT